MHFFPDIPSSLSVLKNISRYLCSRGGQGKKKTNSVGFFFFFITKALLEIDNSHTDLILVTAFCGCQPSQAPSLPLAFYFVVFFLGHRSLFLFLLFSFNCKPIWSMFVFTLSPFILNLCLPLIFSSHCVCVCVCAHTLVCVPYIHRWM